MFFKSYIGNKMVLKAYIGSKLLFVNPDITPSSEGLTHLWDFKTRNNLEQEIKSSINENDIARIKSIEVGSQVNNCVNLENEWLYIPIDIKSQNKTIEIVLDKQKVDIGTFVKFSIFSTTGDELIIGPRNEEYKKSQESIPISNEKIVVLTFVCENGAYRIYKNAELIKDNINISIESLLPLELTDSLYDIGSSIKSIKFYNKPITYNEMKRNYDYEIFNK